ncbi:MAG: hypothetical protein ABID54_00530 [Pseudomonadota bacterium]
MAYYAYLAYFFAGVFLVNGIPHFVQGVSGNKFQSPFASSLGVRESSPVVNVIWGPVNFAIGYVLIFGVGDFTFLHNTSLDLTGQNAYTIDTLRY